MEAVVVVVVPSPEVLPSQEMQVIPERLLQEALEDLRQWELLQT